MNYYEHHIGDYAQATAHLSFVEDAAYSRLLRKYYASEAPLPSDLKQVQRLVGARTPAEKAAVKEILEEFFTAGADGWHNSRADRDIARFHKANAAQEAKRQAENIRQQRTRERREGIFAELRKHGVTPRWNATMKELEGHLSRVTGRDISPPVTPAVTRTEADMTRYSHSPVSIHQSLEEVTSVTGEAQKASETEDSPPPRTPPDAAAFDCWHTVRAAYPAGTYRQADWLFAEKAARMAIDDRLVDWSGWLAAANRYARQQGAEGNVGTRYVLSPSKFFSQPSWREPFPVSVTRPNGAAEPKEAPDNGLPCLNP